MSNTNISTGLGIDQNNVSMFYTPRQSYDVDMVGMIDLILKEMIHEVAAQTFINDPMIKDIKDLSSASQRVIVNRYFISLFLRYRFLSGKNVEMQILSLVNDGYIEDWFKLFKLYIVPFIKDNKILG